MVSVADAVIARLEKGGVRFEVLVDPVQAELMRKGKHVELADLVASPEIFTDCRKGERAKDSDIKRILGVESREAAIYEIIRRGKVQITTEQRRRELEQRKREIASLISKVAIDPRTKAPHPIDRIIKAMHEAKVKVDTRPANQQVEGIIKALKPIIPLSIEEVKVVIKIPAKYAGKAFNKLASFDMQNVKWNEDGSLSAEIRLPAGMEPEFYNLVNSITRGEGVIAKK